MLVYSLPVLRGCWTPAALGVVGLLTAPPFTLTFSAALNPLGRNRDQSSSSNEVSSEVETTVFIWSQAERGIEIPEPALKLAVGLVLRMSTPGSGQACLRAFWDRGLKCK